MKKTKHVDKHVAVQVPRAEDTESRSAPRVRVRSAIARLNGAPTFQRASAGSGTWFVRLQYLSRPVRHGPGYDFLFCRTTRGQKSLPAWLAAPTTRLNATGPSADESSTVPRRKNNVPKGPRRDVDGSDDSWPGVGLPRECVPLSSAAIRASWQGSAGRVRISREDPSGPYKPLARAQCELLPLFPSYKVN
jgi:hypothetical protein